MAKIWHQKKKITRRRRTSVLQLFDLKNNQHSSSSVYFFRFKEPSVLIIAKRPKKMQMDEKS
jgi:hypothetical protein